MSIYLCIYLFIYIYLILFIHLFNYLFSYLFIYFILTFFFQFYIHISYIYNILHMLLYNTFDIQTAMDRFSVTKKFSTDFLSIVEECPYRMKGCEGRP